jgi:hypothetical protein
VAVIYLGPDVPIRSWVHAVRGAGAAGAVIGVVREADAAAAAQVAEAIRAAIPSVTLAIGGRAATAVSSSVPRVTLPEPVVEAAEVLDRILD